MVIQPHLDHFNVYAWVSVLATMLFAFRDLLARKIPAATPSILVTLVTAAVVWSFAACVLLFQGWSAMTISDAGLLGVAAIFLSTAYYGVIAAMRNSELSVVAPFRYVGLLWALVIGYLFWGDVPNALAAGGIVLLIGAGYSMVREQREATPPPPSYSQLDLRAYEVISRWLANNKFRPLGDVHRPRVANPSNSRLPHTFIRVFASDDGGTVVSYYQLKGRARKARHYIEFESQFNDGTFLCTGNSAPANSTMLPPTIDALHLPFEANPGAVMKIHRARFERRKQDQPKIGTVAARDLNDARDRQRQIYEQTRLFREQANPSNREQYREMV